MRKIIPFLAGIALVFASINQVQGQFFNNTPTGPQIDSVDIVPIECSGDSTGEVTVYITDTGTAPAPYRYILVFGPTSTVTVTEHVTTATSYTFVGLKEGIFTFAVEDVENDGSLVSFVNIVAPPDIDYGENVTDISCNGGADGIIDLNITGGNTPYASYTWSPGGMNTEDISGLSAGTYTLVLEDAEGCLSTDSFTVTEPTLVTTTGVITDVTCFGGTDGSVDITVSGGTPPYASYAWTPSGQATEDASGLSAGTHDVIITDSRGCTGNGSYDVQEPTEINIAANITDVSCHGGSDGAIDATVTGGTPPYASYIWNGGAHVTEDISTLTAGNYTLVVTDASGCTQSETFTVDEPNGITITPTITNVSCNIGSDGAIDITVSDGTPPYVSYDWNSGAFITEDITALSAGNYQVTVTDNNGCSVDSTFTVTEPTPVVVNGTSSPISCNGGTNGSIDITASGGTAPYVLYNWESGAFVTEDISGLSAGDYNVVVTDNNGCTGTNTFNVSEPTPITYSATLTNVTCNGGGDGAIDITASGGTPAYVSYSWNSGAFNTEDISSLAAGNYTVRVTDNAGCTKDSTFTITEPLPITVTGNVSHVSCNAGSDGAIDVTVSGGTGAYVSHIWNGGTHVTEDISSLAAGSYTVVVTDAVGCTGTETFVVTEPLGMTISPLITEVSCNDGSGGATEKTSDGAIDITVSGGSIPYVSYSWNTGTFITEDITGLIAGTYTITVTDNNGCTVDSTFTVDEPNQIAITAAITDVSCNSGNDGAIDLTITGGTTPYDDYDWNAGTFDTEDISGLTAGNYIFTIEDDNGCIEDTIFSITEPTPISFNAVLTDVTCNGGTNGAIDLTTSGGTTPYVTYSWNSGAFTTEDISGLTLGTYTVQVTDNAGCTEDSTFTISQPTPVTVTGVTSHISCHDSTNGAIDISMTGGSGNYAVFNWNGGAFNTEDISDVPAGNYFVTVLDDQGCSGSQIFTILEPTEIDLSATITNVDCFIGNTGAIDLSVNGGTVPYASFDWNSGSFNTEDISSLSAGNYSVTVTDNNGCRKDSTFTVTEPGGMTITANVTNTLCHGSSDGAIDLSVSGGFPPYVAFDWNSGAFNTEDISNLPAGEYIVEITDNNGCQQQDTFVVNQPDSITSTAVITNVSCHEGADGAINITATGGSGNYVSYDWNSGVFGTEDISGLAEGQYIVEITDDNGCSDRDTFNITEPIAIALTDSLIQPTCNGDTDGEVYITVTGGTPPYISYNWNEGAFITEDLVGVSAGEYRVEVMDNLGCVFRDTLQLSQPDSITHTAIANLATCNGGADGGLDVTPTGGSGVFVDFNWQHGATTEDIINVTAGEYIIITTDDVGCTGTDTFTIGENTPIIIADSVTDVSCFNHTDGAINVTISGGTPPYATFDWNNGAFVTEDLANIQAGEYILVVTDNVGCESTDTFTITQPDSVEISSTITQVLCFGDSTGAIDISVIGGSAPFTYLWTPGNTTSEDTSGLAAGDYTLTVTDTNNCTLSETITITEPTEMVLTAGTTATCLGSTDGEIDLTITGGTPNYTVTWGNVPVAQTNNEDITSIAGGDYPVAVEDNNNCITRDTVNVTTNPLPTGTFTASSDTTCFGETTTIQAQLDTSVFLVNPAGTYSYDNGVTFSATQTNVITPATAGDTLITVMMRDIFNCVSEQDSITIHTLVPLTAQIDTLVFPTCTGPPGEVQVHNITGGLPNYTIALNGDAPVETSDTTYIGLTAGVHTIVVTDAFGCSLSESINFLSSITADLEVTSPVCFGDCDGRIAIQNVAGGTAPYSFSLNDTITDPFAEADSVFINLCAGNYSVFIKDSTNCVTILNQDLTQPDSLALLNLGKKDISCGGLMDGEVTVSASGGNGGYIFSLNTVTAIGDGPHVFANLSDGTDTVSVQDSLGCSNILPFEILPTTDMVVYPSELTASSGCNQYDGIGIVDSVTGGSGSFQYSINGGGSFQNDSIFTTLISGNYILITRDVVFGCEDTTRFVITAPGGVDMDAIIADITDPSCLTNDGAIAFSNISGGTPTYTFSLDGPPAIPSQTDSNLVGLSEGFYFATVTDAAMCEYDYYFFIGAPTPLTVLATPTNELCLNSDATVNMSITGGVMPYTIQMTDNDAFAIDTTINVGNILFTDLSSGEYNVLVSDSSNPSCTDALLLTISSNRSDALLTTDTVDCPWDENGVLLIDLDDNTNYTFAFSIDDTLNFDTTRTITDLTPGIHELWVKQYDIATGDSCMYPDNEDYFYVPWVDTLLGDLYDSTSYGSMLNDTIYHDSITIPNFIVFAPDSMISTYYDIKGDKNEENGSLVLTSIAEGTPGYLFSLNDSTDFVTYNLQDTTVNIIENLAPGPYTYYVKDSNQCVQPFEAIVGVNRFIPNIFTPNGDGSNDFFEICGFEESFEFIVYNRWGSRVYHHSNYDNSWQGEKLSDGTYYFDIVTESGEKIKGWLEIVR